MRISLDNRMNPDTFFVKPSEWKKRGTEHFFCAHIGPSMNPTLSALDLLEIKPYHGIRPRAGDIVLFRQPLNGHYVVHRIISTASNGIQTKGDNNGNIDPDILKPEDILGKVIVAQRGNSSRKIAGGMPGRVLAGFCHVRRLILIQVVRFLGPSYRFLCNGGFPRRLLPVRMRLKVAVFRSGSSTSHKLLLGKRVIGSYDQNSLRWRIRRPYRIFINEEHLPLPTSSSA